jgi:hypothetical protein
MIIELTKNMVIAWGLFSMVFWMLVGYFLRMLDERMKKRRAKKNEKLKENIVEERS